VNRKTKDGSNHPDRDAQFEYINAKAREFQEPISQFGRHEEEGADSARISTSSATCDLLIHSRCRGDKAPMLLQGHFAFSESAVVVAGYRKEPSAFLSTLKGTTGRPFNNNLLRHFAVVSPCSASAKSMRRRAAWSSSRATCGSAFTISDYLRFSNPWDGGSLHELRVRAYISLRPRPYGPPLHKGQPNGPSCSKSPDAPYQAHAHSRPPHV
jgi:hypothetical protein